MASKKQYFLSFKIFFISLLCLSLFLQTLTSVFQLRVTNLFDNQQFINNSFEKPFLHQSINNFLPQRKISLHDILAKELKGYKQIKIGLVNTDRGDDKEWKDHGNTRKVEFQRVSEELQWEDFMREWINEERWPLPKCPEIPLPKLEEYNDFHMVVSRVPCGNALQNEGIRDVFRLQVNLVVANLLVAAASHRPVYAVFIGSCGAMWEIFRCDDLLWNDGEVWIYKPDLRRLKQKVQMPVGTCRLALPYVKHGNGKLNYLFDKISKTIDHPREAYATVLHSSEDYVCGALALARSITRTGSTKDLVLLADKSITKKSRQALRAVGWKIKLIVRIRNPKAEAYSYNEWNYSKLRLWQLFEYDKIIFIDSDIILVRNIDNFFTSPQLSASSNDKVLFNSGVMLIEPSKCTFRMLMQKTRTLSSYNGGDQGFLNEAFTWWHRWPKKSNFLKMFDVNDTQHELPDFVYVIHYLGWKPWMCYRDYDCNWDSLEHQAYASDTIHKKWWEVYDSMPKKLQSFCAMSKSEDFRIKEQRKLAKTSRLQDWHWKIKIKDSRQLHLV